MLLHGTLLAVSTTLPCVLMYADAYVMMTSPPFRLRDTVTHEAVLTGMMPTGTRSFPVYGTTLFENIPSCREGRRG